MEPCSVHAFVSSFFYATLFPRDLSKLLNIAGVQSFSFLMFHCINVPHFVHSVDEHLDCFQYFPLVNEVAVNILPCVLLHISTRPVGRAASSGIVAS